MNVCRLSQEYIVDKKLATSQATGRQGDTQTMLVCLRDWLKMAPLHGGMMTKMDITCFSLERI